MVGDLLRTISRVESEPSGPARPVGSAGPQPGYGKLRLPGSPTFTASPWAYNGKVFFLSEDGETSVIEAGKEFREIHTNDLDELSLATPSIAQGKLLIRTATRIYCISG